MPCPSHAFAERLAAGESIAEPVALVVAHADDETLWAGAAFPRLEDLTLVHLTDGAPRDMADATRLGFPTREAYAETRAAELDRAVDLLGGSPRRIGYALSDQEACADMAALARRLARDLAGMSAILTHPYEGGHPDHDSAAFAVHAAADLIAAAGAPRPALVEFASYHHDGEARVFGRFWPVAGCPEAIRSFDAEVQARVHSAIAAHASQAAVLDGWLPDAERWRAAPAYDFTAPPPAARVLYDDFGWSITSFSWRERARAALGELASC